MITGKETGATNVVHNIFTDTHYLSHAYSK
jgi:hypothetical protein